MKDAKKVEPQEKPVELVVEEGFGQDKKIVPAEMAAATEEATPSDTDKVKN